MLETLHVSEIAAYNICPRMYRYQYIEDLVPHVADRKPFLGSGVHRGLAAYYEGTPRSAEAGLAAFDEWFEQGVAEFEPYMSDQTWEDFEKDRVLGQRMLGNYFEWAQANDTFEVVAVEQSFKVPIWAPDNNPLDGVAHAGRFDGIARDVYGRLWLMEFKTAAQFPSESTLRLDAQAGYYLTAVQQLFPDELVLGVIYTVIRKVNPARARSPVILRDSVIRNEHELEVLRRRLYRMYKRIHEEKAFDPTPGLHCSWRCPYLQLCIAEEDGSDERYLVDAFFQKRERGKGVA